MKRNIINYVLPQAHYIAPNIKRHLLFVCDVEYQIFVCITASFSDHFLYSVSKDDNK